MYSRKYKILGTLIIALAVFSSCEKGLNKDPFASVESSKALISSGDVEGALVGAYRQAVTDNVYGGDMFVYSELLGDSGNIAWSGTYQGLTQIFNKAIPVNNDFVEGTWLNAYNAINVTNNVIANLQKVSEGKRDRVEGEAKFLRGALYFDLVRLYAKAWNDGTPSSNDGVPIVLTPTDTIREASKLPRSKVSEVYDQVIKDLTEAENLLPETNSFFANKYSAAGMLARVYLQKGDYQNAAAAADRVISAGAYELEANYGLVFPYNGDNTSQVIGNNKEDIFAWQVNAIQGINEFNTFFSQLGRGDIEINESYFADYEPNDDRLNYAFYYSGGSYYCGKYDMVYSAVQMLRLPEMYLIRAESNFRLRPAAPIGGADPADDINIIRDRAGLDPIASGDLTLDDIIRERNHELSFEGHTLHDIKRLQRNIQGIPWNSPKLVFPIPDREIKINKNLTQNEGY